MNLIFLSINHNNHELDSGFYSDFKLKVIGSIVSFLREDFSYIPRAKIDKSEYLASKIFLGVIFSFGRMGTLSCRRYG